MKSFCAIALCAFASPGFAGCVDVGSPTFVNTPQTVRLCLGEQCEFATLTRACGNVQYASEDYSAETATWVLAQRYRREDGAQENAFSVRREPIEPHRRAFGEIRGRKVWLQVHGVELDPAEAGQLTCIPVSSTGACEFIGDTVAGLSKR